MATTYDIPDLTKQPSESRTYTFDFGNNLQEGESIASINSFTYAADDTALTAGTPAFAGDLVQCRLSGGTDGVNYKITVIVTTNTPFSNVLEGEANLFVRAI